MSMLEDKSPPLRPLGSAMRRLLDGVAGTLEVLDPATGEAMTQSIRYRVRACGMLWAVVTGRAEVIDAIRRGGMATLTVDADGDAPITATIDARVVDSRDARIGRASHPVAELAMVVRNLTDGALATA